MPLLGKQFAYATKSFSYSGSTIKCCLGLHFHVSTDSWLSVWYLVASSLEVAASVLSVFLGGLILDGQDIRK
ncbi:hypothetical protein PAHAL_7G145600 [Panicum hallii]|uniref:Uncharacterized protein n=1 Tax=Panicum hallii TaxID=206008 RepID=A0A2S3I6P4_9POAL|nr:hypothetical protein PAHAL_7G145600 [Panicum hallii]